MKAHLHPVVRFTSAMLLGAAFPVLAGPWPAWRGADGTGLSTEKNLPLTWGKDQNVRWRVDLPERGNSSPIVWGDRIFVTQAVSGENKRTLMCFDRATGKLKWQSGTTYTERESTQRENPYCSATPVTDGERVIASFGSAGLFCYDLDGKELWHRNLGKMEHMFGNAASPVLIDDLCILNFGPDEKARLIAVNKRNGETVWEAQPPKVDPADMPPRFGGGGGGPGGDQNGPGGDRGGPGGQRGGGGFGGGGGGGFGPGQMLAPRMISEGDKNADQKLTAEEFSAVAANWFGKLDQDGAGKLDQAVFMERIGEVLLPPPPGGAEARPDGDNQRPGGDGQRPGGGRRGFGGRFLGGALFAAADGNKDGTVTKEEWSATFTKWFTEWDTEKAAALDEAKLREGLNQSLRPQFGGGLGGAGGPGARGGGGQFGGPGRGGGGAGGPGRGGPGGGMGGGMGGASWSTPVLVKADGREELVISFPGNLAAYDPKTGKQLWVSKGLGGTIYSSPVAGEGALFASTSGPGGGPAIAVKPGGNGDVTESRRLWRLDRFKGAIGSGVIREGYLYTISQDGIAACTDLKDGKTAWEERLKGAGSRSSCWSSMLFADGKIYLPNQSGDVFVLRAAPKFELLATNSVNESTNASLAASDGELFLRTDKALWCFGAPKN